MLPHNPFFPKHTMRFKSVTSKVNDALGGMKQPSWGGVTMLPKSVNVKDVLNSSLGSPTGVGATQQLKNYVQGNGMVTDDQAKKDAAVAAQDAAAAALPTSSPTSASGADVLRAQMDLVQQEAMKKSIKKTIFAGDTGGFSPGSAASGTKGKTF
jgi:hypothetical protein